jgi:hypothetical protein
MMQVALLLSLLVNAVAARQANPRWPLWTAESLRRAAGRTAAAHPCAPDGVARSDQSGLNEDKKESGDGAIRRLSRGGAVAFAGYSVQIVGGLVPSATIAAQAGALDPTQAAIAAVGGVAGPGVAQLPHFRMESTRQCFE